jgi:hypothetical protein
MVRAPFENYIPDFMVVGADSCDSPVFACRHRGKGEGEGEGEGEGGSRISRPLCRHPWGRRQGDVWDTGLGSARLAGYWNASWGIDHGSLYVDSHRYAHTAACGA